jgi:hypothetical protein
VHTTGNLRSLPVGGDVIISQFHHESCSTLSRPTALLGYAAALSMTHGCAALGQCCGLNGVILGNPRCIASALQMLATGTRRDAKSLTPLQLVSYTYMNVRVDVTCLCSRLPVTTVVEVSAQIIRVLNNPLFSSLQSILISAWI